MSRPSDDSQNGSAANAAAPASGASAPGPVSGRPEAAAAVWAFEREEKHVVDPAASAGRKRLRGTLQAVVAAALGALLLWAGLRTPAFVVFSFASVIALSALIAPTSVYAGIERVLATLGRLTGQGIGWILLTPVFYLFFAPFGALLRRGRRDRLQRVLEPEAESYWEPHEGMRVASDSYLRQF